MHIYLLGRLTFFVFVGENFLLSVDKNVITAFCPIGHLNTRIFLAGQDFIMLILFKATVRIITLVFFNYYSNIEEDSLVFLFFYFILRSDDKIHTHYIYI